MGWKNIIVEAGGIRIRDNSDLNPLGNQRKFIHPDDEKKLRSMHVELLEHEDKFLQAHRDLGEEIYRIGYTPSGQILRTDTDNMRDLVRTAFGGFRTRLPRFDWQENCEDCARPLNVSESELFSVGKIVPPRQVGGKWRETTQEDIDKLTTKSQVLRSAQTEFMDKKKEFANFIRLVSVSPVARLFNIHKGALRDWVFGTLKANVNSSIPIQRPSLDGNCRTCKRPVMVGEN